MGQAVACFVCNTDKFLKWRTYDERTWWVHCDKCGQVGPEKRTIADAGEAWNAQNSGDNTK